MSEDIINIDKILDMEPFSADIALIQVLMRQLRFNTDLMAMFKHLAKTRDVDLDKAQTMLDNLEKQIKSTQKYIDLRFESPADGS